MKRIALCLLLSGTFCFAGKLRWPSPAILKADRTMVSLKAGTVVELLGRDDKTLTVRYGKITGTVPATSAAKAVSA